MIMRYALKNTVTAQQESIVRDHGDVVWEWLCDQGADQFNVAFVASCPAIAQYSDRTRTDIARVVIANVAAENAEQPAFTKHGHWYRWS